jgi:hypothetical protein
MARPIEACKLCLRVRPLCMSHLWPRKIYARLHDAGDTKHFTLGTGKLIRTVSQIQEYLLCDECEQRFSSNGEQWVIANAFHRSGSFYLRDALMACVPFVKLHESVAYSGKTPGVDLDKLVYFAASVFWRTSVGKWALADRWSGRDGKMDLGPRYSEELRLFLLGEAPFPSNAVLVVYVSDAAAPSASVTFAAGGRQKEGYSSYSFQIPGLMFFIVLGQSLPDTIRGLCAVNNPVERLIFLTRFPEEFTRKWTAEKIATLEPRDLLKLR